jgi:hypothetical protein
MNNEAYERALANDPILQQMKQLSLSFGDQIRAAQMRTYPASPVPVPRHYLSMSTMVSRLERGEDVCIRVVHPESRWPQAKAKPKGYTAKPVAGTAREGCHRYGLLDLLDDDVTSPIYDPSLFEGECGLYFASELLNSDNY